MRKCSQGLTLLSLFRIKLAVGEIIGVLTDSKLLPDLIMKLLILLPNQLVYLLHLHIILLHSQVVSILYSQHTLGLLVLTGVNTCACRSVLVVIDGGLRFVLGFNWQLATNGPNSSSERRALIANTFLQYLPAVLLIEKLLPCLIAECNESVNALHLCILTILGFELTEEGLFEFSVLVVVGMVEAVHAVGGTVRVVPDELFRLVEVLALEELLGLWVGWMR